MTVPATFRLLRACAAAGMTLRETAAVFAKVRRGNWHAETNRELAAQAEYLRRLTS